MICCISGIHGDIIRWNDMLEQIRFSDEDTRYVLGDVIDRIPHGIEILLDIMGCPNEHMVVGNHEEMMLRSFWSNNDYDARRLWKYNGGGSTYRTMVYKTRTEDRQRILRYVQELPDHLEVEVNGRQFHLVHGMAGDNREDRIWGRPEPPPKEPPIPGKTIIRGHTCTFYMNQYVEAMMKKLRSRSFMPLI